MNGYDLAARVRERLGDGVKLIAMSGYGQPEDIRKSEQAGFDRHLTKPVDPRRLANALRDIRLQESVSFSERGAKSGGLAELEPTE
jgi:CheY-like chemotaxis protein